MRYNNEWKLSRAFVCGKLFLAAPQVCDQGSPMVSVADPLVVSHDAGSREWRFLIHGRPIIETEWTR
ncbi:hypothetical protein [Rhodococcus opacus]|uniref:hypothetical protein n=1 Tax=Rhodococcus opacus TaxID=37919 RepID=UPI001C473FF8|nr:hypothetical protein [Rhodococcus opacus]MBV6756860.1 hypothetical protein [Rhodococcus opacus]